MQHNYEQPTGYPHRPPSLRLEQRRTSISVDDVVRRASSASAGSTSPDSNLLRVQANLPGRRHSDNTIQPPRILIAPSSPDGHGSVTNLSRRASAVNLNSYRRHSSVSPHDTRRASFALPTANNIQFKIPNLNKECKKSMNSLKHMAQDLFDQPPPKPSKPKASDFASGLGGAGLDFLLSAGGGGSSSRGRRYSAVAAFGNLSSGSSLLGGGSSSKSPKSAEKVLSSLTSSGVKGVVRLLK